MVSVVLEKSIKYLPRLTKSALFFFSIAWMHSSIRATRIFLSPTVFHGQADEFQVLMQHSDPVIFIVYYYTKI
jgi:hypothetical protein